MAPHGLPSAMMRESRSTPYPTLPWAIEANKNQMAVPDHYDEAYFAPRGSLDRLLRDSRFLLLLKTLKMVPRILSWIEKACSEGCQICRQAYLEQRRMAISLCGHTMCDACLQIIMGAKMKSVYCSSCREEILIVLILDRPTRYCSLNNVRNFLLLDDTPVHDPTLMLGSLVSLWRLGKESPIVMTPCSVEPVPALDVRMKYSKVEGPVNSNLKNLGHDINQEDETFNRKSEAVIQSVLSHLGTDEDPFLTPCSTIGKDDLIDWNLVFGDEDEQPNAYAQHATPRPCCPNLAFGRDVRMDSNFLNFENSCNHASPAEMDAQTWPREGNSNVYWLGDNGRDAHSGVAKTLRSFENRIAQWPENYKPREHSNDRLSTFITEGKILRRRLECPQWIMRVQVIPIVFESRADDLIQLG